MYFDYDFLKTRPTKMYLSKPNKKIITPLNGVEKAHLKVSLYDIWEINFEVDKYITTRTGKIQKNPSYDKISHSMEISVENIGWFRINSYPEEQYSNGRWYKTFIAYGYETTLQDLDLVGININCGTEDSIEMYEENLNELGVPKKNIQFYIKEESNDPTSENYWKLGLLNILQHDYLSKKGWSIGLIETGLSTLSGRQFEINNTNIYQFLVQDASLAYRCIFTFDIINKKINATKVENLGKDLNIELNLRNIINDIQITDRNDDYYTRFRVSGNDSETAILEYINYGSDKIENINYCIESGMLDDVTVEKYNKYKTFLDENRKQYADYSLSYLNLEKEKSILYELEPIAEVDVLFTNVSDEELHAELTHFQNVITLLEELHTNDNGDFNIEGTSDYALYVSVKDVMIPKIQAEIDAREEGKHADTFEYETNWELYGINELEIKLTAYQRQVDVLAEQGYNKPWDISSGASEEAHTKQYNLYLQYVSYLTEINERLTVLKNRVNEIDLEISNNKNSRLELASKANIENDIWGFTSDELSDIYMLYRDTDFKDSTIEVLDTDSLEDVIELAWRLYESSTEELEIESHPQLSYSISLDNLFRIPKFSKKANDIQVGDFCYLELDEEYKTKQRIISLELELVDFNDTDLSFEFSDMTTVCGKADDYRFLLESNNSSSKNSITRQTANYISSAVSSGISTMASQIIGKYLSSSGSSVFPNGINQSDLQKLTDALNGLIGGELSLEELKVKLARIDTLEADSAFVKYLESQYLVGNQAEFKSLSTLVANIDNLLAGTISAEQFHTIRLTTENAVISEALIKSLISQYITVNDLKASNIITDKINILSQDGTLKIAGNTFTICDENGNAVIQLGQDKNGNYGLVITDENGAILLDSTGLHEGIVPDNFIKTQMIDDGAVTEDKIDKTNICEWIDDDGNKVFDVSNMYYGDNKFSVSYTSTINKVEETYNRVTSLESQIASIELMGEQIFKQIQGVVSPETITVTAVCRNGAMIGDWYIDDVLVTDTEYVSDDKMSITIPSSYMLDNNIVPIKVTDSTGELYDLHTLYLISDSTGAKGDDAYTVILQNENVSFSVDNSSNTVLSDQSYSSTVQIFQGTTERTDFTIGEINSANGITISVQDKTVILSVKNGDKITENNGFFTVPILIDDLTFYKDITWNLAKQGETGSSGEPSLNIVIGNESQNIPCSNEGLVLENFLIEIPFTGYKGFNRVDCSVSVGLLPDGVTLGSNTASTPDTEGLIILNVSKDATLGGASVLNGKVTLTFTIDGKNMSRYFTWVKTKDGAEGSMILYELGSSSPILNKNYDDTLSPPTITFNSYYRQSNSTDKTSYAGQFIIAESDNDGATYTNKYLSTAVEDFVEYTPSSASITSIRCTLCSADDVSIKLDVLTVPVLSDVDSIKPIITEITTTMSGVQTQVDAVEKSITDKVWQDDITNSINNYDSTTTESIRSRVSQVEQDVNGIKSTVSDVQTTLTEKADGSTVTELSEKVSTLEQNADGFKQTVEKNYVAKADLNISSRNLLRNSKTLIFDSYGLLSNAGIIFLTDDFGNTLTDENDNILIL